MPAPALGSGNVTATIRTTTTPSRDVSADAIVVGIRQGQDGPVPADGAEDADAALGGNLAQTLATLGATGRAEEVTRLVSGGRLAAPLVAAVGLGPESDQATGGTGQRYEILRRAAGAAVRSIASAQVRSIV